MFNWRKNSRFNWGSSVLSWMFFIIYQWISEKPCRHPQFVVFFRYVSDCFMSFKKFIELVGECRWSIHKYFHIFVGMNLHNYPKKRYEPGYINHRHWGLLSCWIWFSSALRRSNQRLSRIPWQGNSSVDASHRTTMENPPIWDDFLQKPMDFRK